MSEIPTLRGLGDELAGLPDLGKSLSSIFGRGDYDMQQAIKQAIAKDPSVADQLGQLSRDNPQLYGALRLGKLGDSIAKQPEGFQQKREKQTLAQGDATLNETVQRSQNYQDEHDLAPIRASVLKYQNAALQRAQDQSDEAAKGFPDINFKQAVDDFSNGKQTPDVLKALRNPQAMQLFQQMVGYKKSREQMDAAAARQDITQQGLYSRLFAREDKEHDKKALEDGTSFFKKYGIGTPQTWAQYLSDPTTQSTVEGLVQNGIPKGMENDEHLRNLRAIGVALKQDRSIKLDAASRQNTLAADRILKEISAGKVDRDIGLQNVNDLLAENSQNRGTRNIKIVMGNKVAGRSVLGAWIKRNTPTLVDSDTGEALGNVGSDIGDVDKFANQPPSAPYTAQDVAQAKAALPNATPKDLAELQKTHPALYQVLLPEIQRLEQEKKAKKQ